jgi:hypothetical protein
MVEDRIRQVVSHIDDIGNEGNKSTYLRPSRNRDKSSLEMIVHNNNHARSMSRIQPNSNNDSEVLKQVEILHAATVELINREPTTEKTEIVEHRKPKLLGF